MKWIKRIVLLVVVVVVGGAGVTWAMLDTIAKKGIQRGGEYAMGVQTDVSDVKLSLLHGTLMIDTLNVANPEGFTSPHLMKTGKFELEVKPGSVINSPVDVQRFVLDGLDVNIDQTTIGNNISAILDHIKGLGGKSAQNGQPREDQGPGRKMRVGKLVIKNVVAHVHLPVPVAGRRDMTIRLPSIELDDVTKDSPDGVTVGGLIGRIVPAILAAIVEEGKGLIPADLAGAINSDIAGTAQALGGQASKLVQNVGGDASAMVQLQAGKAIKDVQKDAGGLLKGLGGVIKTKSTSKPEE